MLVGQIDNDAILEAKEVRAKDPSAYHITHEGNLCELFKCGNLFCDSYVRKQGIPHIAIGYKHTKNDRLVTPIPIATDLTTGDCVPFNYSPRSVMLNVIFYANSPDLETCCGEDPVVHLRFNVKRVWNWAKDANLRVFITNANAASAHAEVFDNLRALNVLNWDAIEARFWQDGQTKTDKAAELLVEHHVSLALLDEIGVKNPAHKKYVCDILSKCQQHQDVPINVHPDWYYGGSR